MATKDYDFYSDENSQKWSELLVVPLKRITYQVHPILIIDDKAILYLQRLLYRLLLSFVLAQPKTTHEVNQIVMNTFPSPLDEWAVKEAESAVNTSRLSLHQKVSTNIPRDKVGPVILKEFYGSAKPDSKVILYLLTVIDYMAADILKLAGNFVKNSGRSCIFDYDIRVSMNADKALMTLFSQDINIRQLSVEISTTNGVGWDESIPGFNGVDPPNFTDIVKEFTALEGQYITVLKKIQKILADPIQAWFQKQVMQSDRNDHTELSRRHSDQQNNKNSVIPHSKYANTIPSNGYSMKNKVNWQSWQSQDQQQVQFNNKNGLDNNIDNKNEKLLNSTIAAAGTHKINSDDNEISMNVCNKIFGTLEDVIDLTYAIHCSLEEALEATSLDSSVDRDLNPPQMGSTFSDYALGKEFMTYIDYANNYEYAVNTLEDLFENKDYLLHLQTYFREHYKAKEGERSTLICAIRYLLPILLLEPVKHIPYYLEKLKAIEKRCPSTCEKTAFQDAIGEMPRFQVKIEKMIEVGCTAKEYFDGDYILCRRPKTSYAFEEIKGLQNKIKGGDIKDLTSTCTKFIMSDCLGITSGGWKKGCTCQERTVFLLDNLLLACKKRADAEDFSLRYKIDLKKSFLVDIPEQDDPHFGFELIEMEYQKKYFLQAGTKFRKNKWMAALSFALANNTFDTKLEEILNEERNSIPLEKPDVEFYPFVEEDNDSNILFDKTENSLNIRNPQIKAATFSKLVERLTYHKYADPALVKVFLTTYRRFATPRELLESLISRYNIPLFKTQFDENQMVCKEAIRDKERVSSGDQSAHLKRYKKEYMNPIKLRVLNVIKHWVEHHRYDFERDNSLAKHLIEFLDSTYSDMSMQKWVECIRRLLNNEMPSCIQFTTTPPSIEYIGGEPPEEYIWFTLHPLEIARQLTLIQSELFRNIKVPELVGGAYVKNRREELAPNMVKFMNHFNNMTYFIQLSICSMENLEERCALVIRIIDTLQAAMDLNNLSVMTIIVTALTSHVITRLDYTISQIPLGKMKYLEQYKEIVQDSSFKLLRNKLLTVEPPCVPHIGMFLTKIIHIEQGMKETMPDDPKMINFTKRRRFCEVVEEVLQYQSQPYNLQPEKDIQNFLLSNEPLRNNDANDVEEEIFQMSVKIEPKDQPYLKAPRKYPTLDLHSPGPKPKRGPSKKLAQKLATSDTFPTGMDSIADNSKIKPSHSQADILTSPDSPNVGKEHIFKYNNRNNNSNTYNSFSCSNLSETADDPFLSELSNDSQNDNKPPLPPKVHNMLANKWNNIKPNSIMLTPTFPNPEIKDNIVFGPIETPPNPPPKNSYNMTPNIPPPLPPRKSIQVDFHQTQSTSLQTPSHTYEFHQLQGPPSRPHPLQGPPVLPPRLNSNELNQQIERVEFETGAL